MLSTSIAQGKEEEGSQGGNMGVRSLIMRALNAKERSVDFTKECHCSTKGHLRWAP